MKTSTATPSEVLPKTDEFRECVRCLFTTRDLPLLDFNAEGLCSLCEDFEQRWQACQQSASERKRKLAESIELIRQSGRNRAYDCVIGISGGVDSSYLAWKVNELGLRPLAVHFDNGWNSELANRNIENLTSRLGIELRTHVVDWEEFRDLQRAYFRASVVDIEVPTDHGIYGALFKAAIDNNVQYILGGNNIATEGFMPPNWHYQKCDHINLLDIHRRFGSRPLKTYPLFDRRLKKQAYILDVKLIEILDLIDYSRREAVNVITQKLNWREYSVKHGESTFTKFYQGYVLPRKFGIDKRKAHLSNLIGTGEITKAEALDQLAKPVYSEGEIRSEREYLQKKLGFSEAEFQQIMSAKPVSHTHYETEGSLFFEYRWALNYRPLWVWLRRKLQLRARGRSKFFEIR